MEIISRRTAQVIKDLPSARLTLSNELLDIGIDIEKDATVLVSVVCDNGRKKIVIERV